MPDCILSSVNQSLLLPENELRLTTPDSVHYNTLDSMKALSLLPLIVCIASLSLAQTADSIPPSPPLAKLGLSWKPNPESDLLGYYVYRGLGQNPDSLERISGLLKEPNYVDSNVVPGSVYSYAVSAVDTFYFEGALSNRMVGMVPPIEVESQFAMAPSSSRKLIKDERRTRFHVVYSSGGDIRSTWTDCEGCLWKVPVAIGKGLSPSVTVDDSGRTWCVWISDGDSSSILYSILIGGDWTPQDTLIDLGTSVHVRSLSFSISGSGRGWVLADARKALSGSTFRARFETLLIEFGTHRSAQEVTCTRLRSAITPVANTGIDDDKEGNLHIVRERRGKILYRMGQALPDKVVWGREESVSRRTVAGSHPHIACYEDTVYVAWHGKSLLGAPDQVWLRKKPLSSRTWSSAVRMDTSDGSDSRFPVLSGGSALIWVELPPQGGVFCSLSHNGVWKGPIAVKLAEGTLGFPQLVSYSSAQRRRRLRAGQLRQMTQSM